MVELEKKSVSTVAKMLSRNTSTIFGVLKNKHKIRAKLSNSRKALHEEKLDDKQKIASVLREKICVMCLSNDRHLCPLEMCKSKFDICKNLFTRVKFNYIEDQICWECRAHIRQIASFKNKVMKAQRIWSSLNDNQLNIVVIENLSKLATSEVIIMSSTEPAETPLVIFSAKVENVKSDDEDCEPLVTVVKKENEADEIIGIHDDRVVSNDDDNCTVADVDDHNMAVDGYNVAEISNGLKCADDNTVVSNSINDMIHDDSNENSLHDTVKDLENIEEDDVIMDVCQIKHITEEELLRYREEKKCSRKFQNATFSCPDCIIMFHTASELDFHLVQHTKVYGEYSCKVCRLRFPLQDLLDKHLSGHYNMYQCRLCRFECADRPEFKRHCVRNHRSRRCAECDITFSTVSQAKYHRIRMHKQKPTCRVCFKKLSSKSSLRQHMLLHDGMPLFECEVCHKKCRGRNGLAAHQRTHLTEVTEEAYCVECGVQYKNKYVYRAHLKQNSKHLSSKDFKYKCSECGKGFTSPRSLQNHVISTHTKSFVCFCQDCGKGFYAKSSLKKHIRITHEGKEPLRDKLCVVCGKAFKTKGVLKQHMNIHSGARPFACALCPATFAFNGALHTHIRLLHKKLKRRVKGST